MKQGYLNLWKDDYKSDFIIGDSNFQAKDVLLNHDGNVLLKGPRYCGKKHLAYKVANLKKINVYFLDSMLDEEIISEFDKNVGVWIQGDVVNFSKDVVSRINSMFIAEIFELTPDISFALLKRRLERVGLFLKPEMLSYVLHSMPMKYEFLERLIAPLLSLKSVTMLQLRKIVREIG